MKKIIIFGILLFTAECVLLFGPNLVELWQFEFSTDSSPKYGIGGQQNKMKSGSVIYWSLVRKDELYIFVTDNKRRPQHPVFLCYLNYSSTQGSYDAKWSKDGQMMAIYDQGSESGWGPPWVIGYDWKTGKVLQSKEVLRAFSHHKGVGAECELKSLRDPTAEEIKQYKPERLHR